MNLKEEFLFDFAVRMPRILVSGGMAVIDNIQRVELISAEQIVIGSGKRYTAVTGRGLAIRELSDERMIVEGEIDEIRFYGPSQTN